MTGFVAFAEVTAAILASLGIALALEWYGLNGLMRLLPGRSSVPGQRR
jgi:hypothetical protein